MTSHERPTEYVIEVDPVPSVQGVETTVAAFIGTAPQGPLDTPVRVASFREFERSFGCLAPDHELAWAVWQFFRNSGTDALVVRASDATPQALAGQRALRQGLFALDDVDGFSLLNLPGIVDAGVLRSAAAYCEERLAFLLIDAAAPDQTPTDIEQAAHPEHGTLPASSNAAVFYPWVLVADPLGGQPRLAPPGGTVAGVYARTDQTRGIWKTPAGPAATLDGVLQLARTVSQAELADLNVAGVCSLQVLPTGQPCIVGARTLRPLDPGWKYIPVRRLALFLQQSLRRGFGWAAFEPNDERLWSSLRTAGSAFLAQLWQRGALEGRKPEEAFFVQCGLGQTMTPDDVAQGRVHLTIGFAPMRPAEFIVFTLKLATGT